MALVTKIRRSGRVTFNDVTVHVEARSGGEVSLRICAPIGTQIVTETAGRRREHVARLDPPEEAVS